MKKISVPKIPIAAAVTRAFPAVEIFLVGGMVRDVLLGRASKDIDLVVRGVPLPRLIAFLKKHGRVDVVGRTFGVIKFSAQKKSRKKILRGKNFDAAIDIALPRTERAGGSGAYRDVATHSQFDLPIEADLGRRDFTVNAMALNLKTGALVDPFGGAADLRKKIIRAVGSPAARFQEDYTRVLRALRFACQLNFEIEPATWRAIKKFVAHVNETDKAGERKVPHELIGREFLKSLVAAPARFMELWDASGAFKHVAPELLKMHRCPQPKNYHSEGDVWEHTVLALQNLHGAPYKKFLKKLPAVYDASVPASATQYLAVLLHDIAKPLTIQTPARDGVDRIRFSGHDTEGAAVAHAMAERLRFASVEGAHVDVERVAWLVAHHLLAVQAPVKILKATTIEKYFLRDTAAGRELLTMLWADGSATIPARAKDAARHVDGVLTRVRALLKLRGAHGAGAARVIAPLVNGDDIMAAFKIQPGPQIGAMLEFAREAQLTGAAHTKKQILKLLRGAF